MKHLASKLLWVLAILALLTPAFSAMAEGIVVKNTELVNAEEGASLNANIEVTLGQTLEDALKKGVPLYFQLEFELSRPRFAWFPYWPYETVISAQRRYKLSYNALLRQFQVGIETPSASQEGVVRGIGQNFSSLSQALSYMGHLHGWQVSERVATKKPMLHEASLYMKLDVSLLPKPLQVNAIASKSWSLESEVYRWTVTP